MWKILQATTAALFCTTAVAAPLALSLDEVQVVDVERGRVSARRCVRIEYGRIVRIAAAGSARCRRDSVVQTLPGRYLVPGFIDMHAHLTLGPLEVQRVGGGVVLRAPADDAVAQHNARRLLGFGVTTVRSPGGDLAAARRYRAARAEGRWIGPEALFAGPVINDMAIEGLSVVAQTPADMQRIVAAQVGDGADWIKLYTGLSPALLRAGITAAHAHGRPAVGHLDRVAWTDALALGLDGLVHLMPTSPDLLPPASREAYAPRPGTFAFFEWWERFDPDGAQADVLIAALDRHRPVLDATLVAFHAAFVQDDAAFAQYRDDAQRYAHPRLLENWRNGFSFALGWQDDDFRRARAVWPRVQRLAARVYASRARATIGTDLANPWIAPGISLHRELQLLAGAGVPNARLLRAATADAADALGIGRRTGRIARGREADLVVLDADPLRDIAATRAIHAVLDDGVWFDAPRLAQLRGEAP